MFYTFSQTRENNNSVQIQLGFYHNNLPVRLADHKKMFIIATRDSKAFYSFKAFVQYKQARITSQLSLALSTYVLHKWSCLDSTLVGEHNSYSVCNCSFEYTARSIADLHSQLGSLWFNSLVYVKRYFYKQEPGFKSYLPTANTVNLQ